MERANTLGDKMEYTHYYMKKLLQLRNYIIAGVVMEVLHYYTGFNIDYLIYLLVHFYIGFPNDNRKASIKHFVWFILPIILVVTYYSTFRVMISYMFLNMFIRLLFLSLVFFSIWFIPFLFGNEELKDKLLASVKLSKSNY